MASSNQFTQISPHDKDHPALGSTVEEQDIYAIPVNVVPMPAFTDPHNPDAINGSINWDSSSLQPHPVRHSPDYGDGVGPVHFVDESGAPVGDVLDSGQASKPREEWTKADYRQFCEQNFLPVSGNFNDLKNRVEEYEAEQEAVAERKVELADMSDDDLAKIAEDYGIDTTDLSREEVEDAILTHETA